MNLIQKNILYHLLELEGRTSYRRTLSDKTGVEPYVLLTRETRIIYYLQGKMGSCYEVIRRELRLLRLDGYWRYVPGEKKGDPGRVEVLKTPEESLVNAACKIPNYLRKTWVINGRKIKWSIYHDTIYRYLDSVKKSLDHLLFDEKGEYRGKTKLTVFDTLPKQAQLYQKSKTIAEQLDISVHTVRRILNDFRLIFGQKAWHKPTPEERERRVHTRSFTYTIELPYRSELKKKIEKFEKKCAKIITWFTTKPKEYVYT